MAVTYSSEGKLLLRALNAAEVSTILAFMDWAMDSLDAQSHRVRPMLHNPTLAAGAKKQLLYVKHAKAHLHHMLANLKASVGAKDNGNA